MLRLISLAVTLVFVVLAADVNAQTENLALDAKLFASADTVLLGQRAATRSGALQPTDTVAVSKVLRNETAQRLGKQVQVARGEFSPPIPETESFIYLKSTKRGGWQLVRATPFQRLSVFGENKQFGFKDQTGKVAIQAIYNDCYPFSEGLAPVASGDKWGVINAKGEVVVKPQYGRIQPFSHGRAVFETDAKRGFLGIDGNLAIKPIFDNALGFREGLAPVSVKGRWGYIRPDGTTVIEPRFEKSGYFSEGFASVTIDSKVGYINRKGTVVIKPQFDGGGLFRKGQASVMVGEKRGVIDAKGNWVSEPRVLEE